MGHLGEKVTVPSAFLAWQGGMGWVENGGAGRGKRGALCVQGRELSRVWPFGFC